MSIDRQPAPVPRGRPACYGSGNAPDACDRCHARVLCAKIQETWTNRKSLSEMLAEQEAKVFVWPSDNDDLHQVYHQLHREIFGYDRCEPVTEHDALATVSRMCTKYGASPVAWIAVQMHARRTYIQSQEVGRFSDFQTIVLVEKAAIGRWQSYLLTCQRTFAYPDGRNLGNTELDRLVNRMAEEEEERLWLLCRSVTDGDGQPLAVYADHSDEYQAIFGPRNVAANRLLERLRQTYPTIGHVAHLARLRAAVAVASGYNPMFPALIGFKTWDDKQFANLLKDLSPRSARLMATPSIDLGITW